MTRLAVLGSPIAHSRSPLLHTAAYAELGLDWEYSARDISSAELPEFIAHTDSSWRGVSLTMPLKRDVIPLLDEQDQLVRLTGVANTLLFDPDGRRRGFNTDVGGIVRALSDAGISAVMHSLIIGAGATAASAVVALAELGAERVTIAARTPAKAAALVDLGRSVGLLVEPVELDRLAEPIELGLVVSTLPGGVRLPVEVSAGVRRSTTLLDIAYSPWPSALAEHWLAAEGSVLSGLEMLLQQALLQVRIFVSGDLFQPLRDEGRVFDAMRAAVS